MRRRLLYQRVVSITGLLSLLTVAVAGAAPKVVAELERTYLGIAHPQDPIEKRLHRLESHFGLPNPPTATDQRVENLLALDSQTGVQAYNQGVTAEQAGQWETAIGFYRQAVAADPHLFQAVNNLGGLLDRLQRTDEAKTLYLQAVERFPTEALLWRNLGILQEKTGEPEAARVSFQRALSLRPDPVLQRLVAQYTHSAGTVDYFSHAQSDKRLLWRRNPIPVYIATAPDQVPFLPAIQDSLHAWEQASGGRLRFKEVGEPALAGIVIQFREGPLSHPSNDVGHARYQMTGQELKVFIVLNTGERSAPIPLPDRLRQLRRLALHELGHAIGIWGHSPSPQDVMYGRPIATDLSERDKKTLQRLYAAHW
jgi:predicted Zn-dependent protease